MRCSAARSTASSRSPSAGRVRPACGSSTTRPGAPSPGPRSSQRHPQLGAYQLGVEQGAFPEHGATSVGAALLQVGKAALVKTTLQAQKPLADDEDPQWAATLVAQTAEGMAGGTFSATVGEWCKQCQVRSSCPAQPEGRVL